MRFKHAGLFSDRARFVLQALLFPLMDKPVSFINSPVYCNHHMNDRKNSHKGGNQPDNSVGNRHLYAFAVAHGYKKQFYNALKNVLNHL